MVKRDRRKGAGKQTAGELRVIGGTWRGRRIRFPAEPALRPTPDRLRETLFNWLGEWIVGRRVLDLYAGSGALGIEALSRGAREAVFVEHKATALESLRANLDRLAAATARVERADVRVWLTRERSAFDLVFLDPPYAMRDGAELLTLLAERGVLAPDHRVYLEQSAAAAWEPSGNWELLRASRAGGACGRLLRLDGLRFVHA